MTRAKGGPSGDRRGTTAAATVSAEAAERESQSQEAVRRWKAGETRKTIAAAIGVSVRQLDNLFAELGIDPNWLERQRARLAKRKAERVAKRRQAQEAAPRARQRPEIDPETRQRALERYIRGESARAVALDLGLSQDQLYDWARAAGIRKERGCGSQNQQRRAEAVQLWRSGVTAINEIAKRLGVTGPAVSRWLSRAGVREIRHRPLPDELVELRGVAVDDLEATRRGLIERGYTETSAREPGVGEYRIDRDHEVLIWRERPRWYTTGEAAVALTEAVPELPPVAGDDVRGLVRCGLLAGPTATSGGTLRIPRRAVEALLAARRRHAARLAELEDSEGERRAS